MKYCTIVADPPWPMKDSGPRSESTAGFWRTDHTGTRSIIPYDRMTVEEIAALPVRALAEKNAHLYLWTTSRFLDEAFDVLRAWGFHYALTLVWCKAPRGQGFGGAFSGTTEFVLLAKRGNLPHIGKVDTTWFQWKRPYVNGVAAHSYKPEGMQDEVERVSPGPYLELFARRQRLGWDTWGNEALEHVTLLERGTLPHEARLSASVLSPPPGAVPTNSGASGEGTEDIPWRHPGEGESGYDNACLFAADTTEAG